MSNFIAMPPNILKFCIFEIWYYIKGKSISSNTKIENNVKKKTSERRKMEEKIEREY